MKTLHINSEFLRSENKQILSRFFTYASLSGTRVFVDMNEVEISVSFMKDIIIRGIHTGCNVNE